MVWYFNFKSLCSVAGKICKFMIPERGLREVGMDTQIMSKNIVVKNNLILPPSTFDSHISS